MTKNRRLLLWMVASPLIVLGALFGLVLSAAGAVFGSDHRAGAAAPIPAGRLGANVAPGRPCADALETQGYKPGPGAFEPNHTGIDFVCLGDRTIVAVLPGVVYSVQRSGCPAGTPSAGYGCNVVVESHVGGHDLFVRYAHAVEGSAVVSVGQTVVAGTPLETEDSTGFSTGPHIHFEVDDGAPRSDDSIDPAQFLDPRIVG